MIKKIDIDGSSIFEKYTNYYNIPKEIFDYKLKDLDNHLKIRDLKKCAIFIEEKIKKGESDKILLVGDYDADGITSCSLFYLFIKDKFNISIEVYIPEREKDGYGLQPHIVEYAKDNNKDLIITVDNGISAFSAVEKAKELNIEIIITDHHTIQEKEPNALFVINPLTEKTTFREKHLAGVGVIFFVLYEIDKNIALKYLPLVALGTIADVMPMTNDNRILVKEGLLKTPTNVGLKLLYTLISPDALEVSSKYLELTNTDIGFTIAPIINSAGRLNNARKAFLLLIEEDLEKAKILFEELKELNIERKKLQENFENYIINNVSFEDNKKGYIIVEDDNFNFISSINGIIASKILEKTKKPVFVLSKKTEQLIGGSGRSTEWFNLSFFINRLKKENLLYSGGGHSAAAGIIIKKENLEKVKLIFEEETTKHFKDTNNENLVFEIIDIPNDKSTFKKLLYNLYKDIKKLEPFGNSFPKPLIAFKFDNNSIEESKSIKENKHYYFKLSGHKIYVFNKNINDCEILINNLFIGEIQRKTFINADNQEIEYFQLLGKI